jgi:ketosteroid isomerase-like protein
MAAALLRLVPLVVSLLAVPFGVRAGPASAADLKELTAITQSLMDALASGKKEVWDAALAEDAIVVDEFGRVQQRKEAVDGVTGLPPGFSGEIRLLNPKAQVYGDAAVFIADADEYETVFGQKLHIPYRMTSTFVRRDGRWRLAAMHTVTVPTTPPALSVDGLKLDDYPGVYRYAPERAFTVSSDGKTLSFTTRVGRPATRLLPLARDVFMDDGDEKNLFLFRRDASGRVVELIERRKFNDLSLKREVQPKDS